jgi:hypothetical protein
MDLCADGGLLRGKEGLYEAAFAADDETLESFIPRTDRNRRTAIKPVRKLNKVLCSDSSFPPALEEVTNQVLRNIRPLNLWHGLS